MSPAISVEQWEGVVERPLTRRAARGNRFQRLDSIAPTHYAFASEGWGKPGRWTHLRLACVDAAWMDRVWETLVTTPEGVRFFNRLSQQDFEKVYPALDWSSSSGDGRLFHLAFWWFAAAVIGRAGGFGRAPMGYFEIDVREGDGVLDVGVQLCCWYSLRLEPDVPQDADAPNPRRVGRFLTWAEDPKADTADWRRLVDGSLSLVPSTAAWRPSTLPSSPPRHPSVIQGGLQALHFPQPDLLAPPPPAAPPPPSSSGDGGPDDEPDDDRPDQPAGGDFIDRGVQALRRAGATARSSLQLFVDGVRDAIDRLSDDGLVFGFAGAGGHGDGVAWPRHFAYTGSPLAGGGAAAAPNPWAGLPATAANQVQNPMVMNHAVAAHSQPYVAALNIGQGNCSALVDRANHVRVYFDFGYGCDTAPGRNTPVVPTAMCLCQNPLIIISHWDRDHWSMARRDPRAYALRWIAPCQPLGTADVENLARVLERGGELHMWMSDGGGAGSHMRFPWGFVERCNGPPLAQRNSSGLVAYVAVKENAADAAQAANLAAGAPPLAAPLGAGAPPGLPGLMQVAVQPAAGGIFATLNLFLGYVAPTHAAALARQAVQAYASNVAAAVPGVLMAAALAPVAGQAARIRLVAAAAAAAAWIRGGGLPLIVPLARFCARAYHHAVAPAAAVPAGVNLERQVGRGCANDLAAAFGAAAGVPDPVRVVAHSAAVRVNAAYAGGANAALLQIGAGAPAAHVTALQELEDQIYGLIQRAIAGAAIGAVAAPVVPTLHQNPAPFTANERYILLTGDGNFSLMPSQLPAPPPQVVGLLATHHGSNLVDSEAIQLEHIPWYARSQEAALAAMAVGSLNNTAPVMANTLAQALNGGAPATNRARLLAATAVDTLRRVVGLPAGHGEELGAAAVAAVGARWECFFAGLGAAQTEAAAAAAAVCAFCYPRSLAPYSIGWAAAQAAAAAAPNIPFAGGVGAASVVLDPLVGGALGPHPWTTVFERLIGSLIRHYAANPPVGYSRLAQTVRQCPLTPWVNCAAHLEDLVRESAAAVAAIAPPAAAAGAVGPLPPVHATVTAAVNALVAAGAGALTYTQWANRLGALGGAGAHLGLTAVQQSALREAAQWAWRVGVAPVNGGAPQSGRLACSYGLSPNGAHCYPARPGPLGHPHPTALAKYASHGWTARRNTPNTTASDQPDPSPWGHVALGWEDVPGGGGVMAYEGPLRPAPAGQMTNGFPGRVWACPVAGCGVTWNLVV